jgi:hypothetical protein
MYSSIRLGTILALAILSSGTVIAEKNYCTQEVAQCGDPTKKLPCVITLYINDANTLQVDRGRVWVDPLTTIQWTTNEGTSGDTFSIDFNNGTPYKGDTATHFQQGTGKLIPSSDHPTKHNCVHQGGQQDCGCYRVYKYSATLTIGGGTPKTIDPDVIIDAGGGPGPKGGTKRTPKK